MRYLSLAVLSLLGTATALAAVGKRPTQTTLVTSKTTASLPLPTYKSCGGFRIKPIDCAEGEICMDNPYVSGCGLACDMPGICVTPVFCGGFAGIPCKDGKICVDDPRDDCSPTTGGADCSGLCIRPPV